MVISSWLVGAFAGAASAVVLYPACLLGSMALSMLFNSKDQYGEGLMNVGHYAGIIAPIAVALWIGSGDMREANAEMAARLKELSGQNEETHDSDETLNLPSASEPYAPLKLSPKGHIIR